MRGVLVAVLVLMSLQAAHAIESEPIAQLSDAVARSAAQVGYRCGLDAAEAVLVRHIGPDEVGAMSETCIQWGLSDEGLTYETMLQTINEVMDSE